MTTDLYLPCRHSWFLRIIGRGPTLPRTGDRGPVIDALHEVVDAAGGLEYSREALRRAMAVAQKEFDVVCVSSNAKNWGGANTPAVYYEFCNAVNGTRSVEDRYEDRLRPALRHDAALWRMLQKIEVERRARSLTMLVFSPSAPFTNSHRLTPTQGPK